MGYGDTPQSKASLNPSSPIDGIVTDLISTIANKGRGFTLGLAKEANETKISVVEQLQPHDEWLPPAASRNHKLDDVESLAMYARKYGDKAKSIILCGANSAELVLDEGIAKGDTEGPSVEWVKADDWVQWENMLKSPMQHRQLHQFLMRHEHNLEDPGMLLATSKIRAMSTVDHNSDLNEGGNTFAVVFKTAKGEDLIKFPRAIPIQVPVLESDYDNSVTTAALIKIEILMPLKAGDSVLFQLYCSEWASIYRKRIAQESEKIRKLLPDFLIMNGVPFYQDIELPE